MKLSQRMILITIISMFFGIVVEAQMSQLPSVSAPSPLDLTALNNLKDDGCPPAEVISDTYTAFAAQVIEVVDGNTLIVESEDGKRKVIHMVGIAAPDAKTTLGIAAKNHLATSVLGKNIEVWLISTNGRKASNRAATGEVVITAPERLDVNLEQIKSGMAQYRNSGPYTQNARNRCLCEKFEAEAKVAKRGMWAQ
jgi:endonuclease YncB( thermonuclease family)